MTWLMLPVFVTAQTANPDNLKDLEKRSQAAQQEAAKLEARHAKLRKDIASLRQDLVKAAQEANRYETQGRATQKKITALERQMQSTRQTIYENKQTLSELLAALQMISTSRPPILTSSAENTLDLIHTAQLMSGVSENLRTKADILATDLKTLEARQLDIEAEQAKLGENEAALEKKRQDIKILVETKSRLEKDVGSQSRSAQSRAQKLATEAADLRELIVRFEQAAKDIIPRIKPDIDEPGGSVAKPRLKPRPGSSAPPLILPSDVKRFADARGLLQAPVIGTVKTAYSSQHKGITLSTRPNAPVLAPYAGRVEFAGPFKNYGNVIILNVGDDYFILMTGLGDIFAESSEIVDIGQPLGQMPSKTGAPSEIYMEFRKNGRTINPKPWLGTLFAQSG